MKEYFRNYQNDNYKHDLIFRLKAQLRARLRMAFKTNQRKGSAVRDLGCSIEFLKKYIEDKFYGNMTWNNWGTIWELDHIKELHTFDLIDRAQLLEAVHYINLQPLTIEDHKHKSAQRKVTKNSN